MINIKTILFFFAIICPAADVRQPYKDSLNVIFTSDYDADSITINTKSERYSLGLTTNPSLGMAIGRSVVFAMQPEDSIIFVSDILRDIKDSVRFKPGHPFLYVYYDNRAFSFRYAKTPVFFE